ncbi:histone deacetylase [Streptomyces sp. PKU-MA01144]|uniref:histone deacetylase n=1 Tax=Streptomyces sp. PKU-MA01144 TaxID=2729138 RepID=UPI0014804664|nr:histone deacetylase [Streptomyces sp. PKU-MA01144]NNJ03420.1 histone deacetylase [Streptomyces sp. PKU-MA01144]
MKRARTIDTTTAPFAGHSPAMVWYTAYGSNTHLERLSHYLTGGRPRGAARTYPGCRDPRPPAASVPVEVPGALYFATRSPVWRGGRAFFDPAATGTVLARAHLVTAAQFSDIVAQEMYRAPGADLDLSEALARGRAQLGGGRYETLVCPGALDGRPVLTFTAPWSLHDVEWTRPSAAYLRHLVAGLLDAGAWPASEIAAYLAARPGAAGHWTADAVAALTAGR